MKKIKKLVSALAAGAMLASMAAFPVSAADEAAVAEMQSALNEMVVTQEEMSADALAVAQAQEMLAEIQSTNESFTYPYYTKYATSGVANSQHYLGAIPTYGQLFPSDGIGVYFYVNTNIQPDSPNAMSNFMVGSGYKNGLNLINPVTSSTETQNRRKILARFGITGSFTATSELFTYKLGDEHNMGTVNSEQVLHKWTSKDDTTLSTLLESNVDSSYTFQKCVFARGDVNRDGQLTTDDSKGVLCYLVGTAEAARTGAGGYYDEIAFKMAADFDRDGDIDLSDVVGINRRIAVPDQEEY